jgi:rubrerythrin
MKNTQDLQELLGTLNQALRAEYSMIIHYPRIASSIKDAEIKELVVSLGIASIKHADKVASAINKLGGEARWSFEGLPDEEDLVKIFRTQLGKENLALELHRKSASLVNDFSLRRQFEEIADEEKVHIDIVNNIITKLEQTDR